MAWGAVVVRAATAAVDAGVDRPATGRRRRRARAAAAEPLKSRPKRRPRTAGLRAANVTDGQAPLPVAELSAITRVYPMGGNKVLALDRFTFTFNRGEYWSIMG
jgi:hypothetical protein